MPDLELHFSTHGELEGAKNFAKQLERNIGKMKAMGQDASALTAQLSKLNSAITASEEDLKANASASGRAKDASNDLNQAAGRLTSSKERLRSVVRGLAVEFPMLARVMGFVNAPVTLLIAGFAMLVGWLNKTNEALKEAAANQNQLEALKNAVTTLAEKLAELEGEKVRAGFTAISKHSADAEREVTELNAAIDATRAKTDQLAEAELQREKAKINAAVAAGTMSASEGAAATATLEGDAEAGKNERFLQAEESKIANKQKLVDKLAEQIRVIPQRTPEELKKMEVDAEAAASLAAGSKADFTKTDAELAEKSLTLQGQLQDYTKGFKFMGMQMRSPAPLKYWSLGDDKEKITAAMQADIDAIERERSGRKDRMESDQAQAVRAREKVTTEKAQQQHVRELQDRRNGLRRGVDRDRTALGLEQETRGAEFQINIDRRGSEVEAVFNREQREQQEKAQREHERLRKGEARGMKSGPNITQASSAASDKVARSGAEAVNALESLGASMTSAMEHIIRAARKNTDDIQKLRNYVDHRV